MNNYSRPDERAAQSEIERAIKFQDFAKKGVQTAVGLGSAVLGAGIGTKILPFLSEFIPSELAVKGISKISPKVGDFLKKGMESGLDIKEGLNFLKEKMAPTPNQQNIIEQYSPELFQFLKDQISNGQSPLSAGALAELKGNFKSQIKKMVTDHKAPFSSIIESVFGQGNQAQPQQPQPQQQPQGGIDPKLAQLMEGIRNSIQNIKGR